MVMNIVAKLPESLALNILQKAHILKTDSQARNGSPILMILPGKALIGCQISRKESAPGSGRLTMGMTSLILHLLGILIPPLPSMSPTGI